MNMVSGSPWMSRWTMQKFLHYSMSKTECTELVGLRLARTFTQRLTNDNSRVERTRKE